MEKNQETLVVGLSRIRILGRLNLAGYQYYLQLNLLQCPHILVPSINTLYLSIIHIILRENTTNSLAITEILQILIL